jgi:hypothetical protein
VPGGCSVEGYFPDTIDPLKGFRLVKVSQNDGRKFPKALAAYEVETAVLAGRDGKAQTVFVRASYLEDVDFTFSAAADGSSILAMARKAQ